MDKRLIYIADDEVNILNIIKSFLVKEGYEVETFNNGQSILDAFSARPADMLVIDVMMPGMDGFAQVGQRQRLCDLALFALSDPFLDLRTGAVG
jgi:DNA-binding response OmpR family regulator